MNKCSYNLIFKEHMFIISKESATFAEAMVAKRSRESEVRRIDLHGFDLHSSVILLLSSVLPTSNLPSYFRLPSSDFRLSLQQLAEHRCFMYEPLKI
jgi:hypothetical protein